MVAEEFYPEEDEEDRSDTSGSVSGSPTLREKLGWKVANAMGDAS